MASKVLVVIAFCVASVAAQDVVSDCPIPDGYFADSVQCDKYYECIDNVLTEKLCPDGKAFNDFNHRVEKCDFIYQIDCKGRPELQPPQATETCPRANGYFPHHELGRCNEFYYCSEGKGNHLTCPESLVFSLKTGTCVWPDEAGRTDECNAVDVVNFTCPTVPSHEAVAHPRYADPDDCQYFYVCINGKTPRRNGCNFGQVFNSKIRACDSPKEVPECAEYYFDYFTQYFADLGDSGVPSPEILQAAVVSGFDVPQVAKRVRVRPSSAALAASDGVRRRRPSVDSESRPQIVTPLEGPQFPQPGGKIRANAAPVRKRRPSLRTPARAAATTTTTTTAPPEAADDYYYYDDYPESGAGDASPAPAPPVEETPASNPVSSRFNLARPSRS
ncbi:Chitin binding domain [Trinorchestia longiramus]|nr:Chitin binding domain [Trinorchestia longiramus]